MSNDELITFAKENFPYNPKSNFTWKILIVDDEEDVHQITKLVLSNVKIEGIPLEFFDAYSAKEAKMILQENLDIAVILLDVVMETEDAGLNLVEIIRKELNNSIIRIVLRTGQPGQAPEKEVITKYDINDYKDKTELTAQKLFTLMHTSINSYKYLYSLNEKNIQLSNLNNSVKTFLTDDFNSLENMIICVDNNLFITHYNGVNLYNESTESHTFIGKKLHDAFPV